jgi:hypothetical protein
MTNSPSDAGGQRLRVWMSRHRRLVVALAIAGWLLVALIVGMATSGGVVWF